MSPRATERDGDGGVMLVFPLYALEYFIMITKQRDNKESETKKTSKFPNIVRPQ